MLATLKKDRFKKLTPKDQSVLRGGLQDDTDDDQLDDPNG